MRISSAAVAFECPLFSKSNIVLAVFYYHSIQQRVDLELMHNKLITAA